MSETSSIRSSVRSSTFLNRPQIAPMGPRTRQGNIRSSSSLRAVSTPATPAQQLTSLNLPEFGGRMSPESIMSPTSPAPSSLSARKSLPALTEEPQSPDSAHPSNLLHNALTASRIAEDNIEEERDRYDEPLPDSGQYQIPEQDRIHDTQTASDEQQSLLPYEQPYEPDSEYDIPESPPPEFQADPDPPHNDISILLPEPILQRQSSIQSSLHQQLNDEPSETPAYEASTPVRQASIREPSLRESSIREPSLRERSTRESVMSTSSIPDSIRSTPPIPPSPAPSKMSFAIPTPPPKITPPPAIKFESTPVTWKGLPMEAALWTVDSGELQTTVSRAIRASASEAFVRLLTVENLDTVLPAELERLEHEKLMAQSKYRFLVHRRTMLFQALNSTALGHQKDGEDGVSVVSKLAGQLADTIGECDQKLEEVIQINDQIGQIRKLVDVHWSSALAIALRKLNGSFARRNDDLAAAKERITQLEAELGEAWKEAERMAKELDDYEAAIVAEGTDEGVIEMAEVVTVPKTHTHTRRASTPMSPTLVAFVPSRPMSPSGPLNSPDSLPANANSSSPKSSGFHSRQSSPVTDAQPQAGPSHSHPTLASAPLRSPNLQQFAFPPNPRTPTTPIITLKSKEHPDVEPDVPDTVSLRSTRSTRSAKSSRSTKSHKSNWSESGANYVSAVHAAKKRSHRASQSSLRLAMSPIGTGVNGHGRKRSNSNNGRTPTPYDEHPPVPELPVQYSVFNGIASANASSTLPNSSYNATPPRPSALNLNNIRSASSVGGISALLHPSPRLRRQVSLDSVLTGGGRSIIGNGSVGVYKGKAAAADDLYLRPLLLQQHQHQQQGYLHPYAAVGYADDSESDIQMVDRTPRGGQFQQTLHYDRHSMDMNTPPRPPPKDPSKTIPSMWMNADAAGHHTIHHQRTPSSSALRQTQSQQYLHHLHAELTAPLSPSNSVPDSTTPSNTNSNSGASIDEESSENANTSAIAAGMMQAQGAVGSRLGSLLLKRQASTNARTSTAYSKLRGLTKRYSVSLPMFNSQPRSAPRRSG